jgi:hypothetical protein
VSKSTEGSSSSGSSTESLSVRTLLAEDEPAWNRFIESSANATLFHDPRFLAYHPKGRFEFRHLFVERGTRLAAIFPGGLRGEGDEVHFISPVGASIGGPALAKRATLVSALELVEAIKHFAAEATWAGVEMVLAPSIYDLPNHDTLAFALSSSGFQLVGRDLSFAIAIQPNGTDRYASLFRSTQANLVRGARRNGVTVERGGLELLPDFLSVFADTYARHGVSPTHTPEEIADLLVRLPDRIFVVVAKRDGVTVAAVLLFLMTSHVALTFYICSSTEHARENGTLVIIAALLDDLAADGFHYLDLGPSASEKRTNTGVVNFKESLGAFGTTRDRWVWSATNG